MTKINILVWDAVGNVTTGMREWDEWPPVHQQHMLEEDPDAIAHSPSIARVLAGYDYELHFARSVEEVSATIEQADFLIVHKNILPAEVLLRGRKLRLVQHLGLDYRGIPMDAARELDVPVAATPLLNYIAVAEHAWALILNYLKQLPQQRVYMQSRAYLQHTWGPIKGIKMVRDQVLGLVGFGEIARPMARIAGAFGMRVIYWDGMHFENLEAQYGVTYVGWEQLWRQADVISVHLPINNRTQGIVGQQEIGWMKPGALFVNTARGMLLDQPALVEALREHRIGGAALDVYEPEPPPIDDPIHSLHEDLSNNVTLTPHSAWQGPWTWVHDSQEIWFNIRRVLDGEAIRYQV